MKEIKRTQETLDNAIEELRLRFGDSPRTVEEIDLSLLATKDDVERLQELHGELQIDHSELAQDVIDDKEDLRLFKESMEIEFFNNNYFTNYEFTGVNLYGIRLGRLCIIGFSTGMQGSNKTSWNLWDIPASMRPPTTRNCFVLGTNWDANVTTQMIVVIPPGGKATLTTNQMSQVRVGGTIAYLI